MPKDGEGLEITDPYAATMQWSRRFIGLKLFLTLAVAGWDGLREVLEHQTAMADLLRRRLPEEGWRVVNETSLPVVCFVDDSRDVKRDSEFYLALVEEVLKRGQAWISTVSLPRQGMSLRACITNFRTAEEDVDALLDSLAGARAHIEALPAQTQRVAEEPAKES
jgi:glutamate/tyrosine decarboxylase-like PLP-dependent enzyme